MSLFFMSCKDIVEDPNNIDPATLGKMAFSMSIAEAQTLFGLKVDSVTIKLQGPTPVNGRLTIGTDTLTASGTFSNLSPGNYTIFIAVFSGVDTIASGTGNATVNPGQTTTANIALKLTNGKLLVNVTWPNSIPVDGLVAYYPFNGNANDESGNGNNCAVTNCTLVSDRFNNLNRAYSFNGTSSRITGIANPAVLSLTQVTLSAWVKINGYGKQFPRIIGVAPSGTSSEKYGMYFNIASAPRAFGFLINPGPTTIWSQTLFSNDNVWHHLLITFDGNMTRFFIDNVLDKTVNSSLTIGQFTSGHMVVIGGGSFTGNDIFDGVIDDARIYNRALSNNEIQALYLEK